MNQHHQQNDTGNFALFSLSALLFGFVYAAILRYTRMGQWLTTERTWITVVIGIFADFVFALPVTSRRDWSRLFVIVAASGVGVIANELDKEQNRGRSDDTYYDDQES